jgi:hypothetical protein
LTVHRDQVVAPREASRDGTAAIVSQCQLHNISYSVERSRRRVAVAASSPRPEFRYLWSLLCRLSIAKGAISAKWIPMRSLIDNQKTTAREGIDDETIPSWNCWLCCHWSSDQAHRVPWRRHHFGLSMRKRGASTPPSAPQPRKSLLTLDSSANLENCRSG